MTISELVLSDSVSDFNRYNGANGLEIVQIGDRTFVYTAAFNSDRITIDELFADGTLNSVGSFDSTATTVLNGISGFASFEIAGQVYLYAVAEISDAVTVFEVADDGALTSIQTIVDDVTLELDAPFGELTIASAGGNDFLIIHGFTDDGLSVFQIASNGTLTNTANLDDAQQLGFGLDGAADTAFIEFGGRSMVFATGANDDALTIFELTAAGGLTLLSSLADTSILELNGAEGVDVAVVGGVLYAYVGGASDSGISVFSIDTNGIATNVFNYEATPDVALSGVNDLDIFEFDGVTYLGVTGQFSDGVTVFEVGADGSLAPAASVFNLEDPLSVLNDVRYLDFIEIDGRGLLVSSSFANDGLSVFQLDPQLSLIEGTDGNDVLVGIEAADTITGLDGDDVIIALGGDDRIDAGEGSDVVNGGDGDDQISGDGDLTQTASDVVTVTETGQDLALTVTLPDSSDGSTIEINGIINRSPLASADFNIAYVIDVSGSMGGLFSGNESVPDLNNDGSANTLLDGTIAAFSSLNDSIAEAGFTSSDIAIIPFDSSASTLFTGTVLSDVDSALESLQVAGGTNFENPLQVAIAELANMGSGENIVYFISDGDASTFNIADEVATLTNPNGLNATVNVFGLGAGANLNSLDLVDDFTANNSVSRILLPSALTTELAGSPVQTNEVDRLEVYVNGVLTETVDGSEFALTPFGLQYNATIAGLSTTAGDTIEVVLVASDASETQVDVSLTVPNEVVNIGDDVLIGGGGRDILNGDGGDDTLLGEADDDVLNGGVGDDFLDGGGANDRLVGGGGDDTLIGGEGEDTLQGGLGDDVYYIGRGDVVDESTGANADFDTLVTSFTLDLTRIDDFMGSFEGIDLIGNIDATARGDDEDNRLDGNIGDNLIVARDGDDTVSGDAGDDRIAAGGGDDSVRGDAGDDTIFGNSGNDTLRGISGENDISAGTGDDLVVGGINGDTIDGGTGDDRLVGGSGDDDIAGGDDNDELFGNNGDDTLNGEDGTDELSGGNGEDLLLGRDGDDSLFGGNDDDRLFGGADDDLLSGNDGDDDIQAGSGIDRAFGGSGDDTIDGGTGDDLLSGSVGEDLLLGRDGEDTLLGGDDDDRLFGGADDDALSGNDGDDDVQGGSGDDRMYGGIGADTLDGGTGEDDLDGGSGNDLLFGRDGDDTIGASDGDDRLFGGADDDQLAGNDGDDDLQGGSGDDRLFGGAGADTIEGGTGTDLLNGGSGADVFVFDTLADSTHDAARDTITDFTSNVDQIDLSGLGNSLSFVAAYTGVAGQVRYNDTIGRLYVDIDGDAESEFSVNVTGAPQIDVDDLIF